MSLCFHDGGDDDDCDDDGVDGDGDADANIDNNESVVNNRHNDVYVYA